jgi:cell division FtsZ-interacting protein ZapD
LVVPVPVAVDHLVVDHSVSVLPVPVLILLDHLPLVDHLVVAVPVVAVPVVHQAIIEEVAAIVEVAHRERKRTDVLKQDLERQHK